jgi:hypothetical protein
MRLVSGIQLLTIHINWMILYRLLHFEFILLLKCSIVWFWPHSILYICHQPIFKNVSSYALIIIYQICGLVILNLSYPLCCFVAFRNIWWHVWLILFSSFIIILICFCFVRKSWSCWIKCIVWILILIHIILYLVL